MIYIFLGALGLIGAVLIFWGLKGAKAKLATVGEKVESRADQLDKKFRTEWSDADEYVALARRLWPSLRSNPFFWSGIATSTMICVLGIMGSRALGQGVIPLTILWMGVFVVANLVQAWIAVLGDHGRGEWYEFKSGDRPTWHWPVLVLLLFTNFVASWTGSSNVSEVLRATSEINASGLEGKQTALKQAQQDLDALRTRRLQEAPGFSAEALQEKATLAEEKASIEEKTGKGPNYKRFKSEATKWRALANDAVLERKIGEKIAVLQAELKTIASDGTARTVASPHAKMAEEATGGLITERQVNKYFATIFWIFISIVDIALWLWAGDYAGRYRQEQYRIRAEAANESLVNAGMEPRYKISEEGIVTDTKALPSPDSVGDTVNINLSESAQARIDKSDRLKKIQAFFDAIMIEAEGSKISIGRAYEIFSKLRQEQGERKFMNQVEFRSAVTDYCEIMGIELISNQIIGYKVGLASTAEAAE